MQTGDAHTSGELEIAGIPAVRHLRHGHRLSQQLLDHLTDSDGGKAPAARMPCGVARREAADVIAGCLDLVAAALGGRLVEEVPAPLHNKIEAWAADGIALEAVHHATHRGFRFVLDLLARHAYRTDGPAMEIAHQRLGEVLDRVVTTFTQVYLREFRADALARQSGAEALTAALLAGTSTAGTARESGFRESDEYAVLAVDLAAPAGEDSVDLPGPAGARRRLRRVRAELSHDGAAPLARLTETGGTVLVPGGPQDDSAVTRVFERLQDAVRGPLPAAVVHAYRDDIPAAARRAHELLDLAQRLHRPARLYRLADLAVEYQITRPGPARRRLAATLEPLLSQPDLLRTLSVHLAHGRNRQRAARVLSIHTNTLDYRLRRVAQATGLDPARPDHLWQLQAALVASTYETAAAGAPLPAVWHRADPQRAGTTARIGRGERVERNGTAPGARVSAPRVRR